MKTKNENKSVYQAVIDIIKREGIVGLYSGLNSSLLGVAVTNGNPIWVVQTSQAVHTMNTPSDECSSPAPKKPGMLDTAAQILRTGGFAGLWRGIGPALVLVINPVLQYTVFEQLKNTLVRRRRARAVPGGTVLTDLDFFILGALSKLVATGITYPYIVVKSRLQGGHAGAQRYRSTLHGLQTIVKEEGIDGLYKGVGSKLTQSVLTAAILFAGQRRIFEITKRAISPVVTK
ncbi:hypothetical protein EWM64_g2129 [Hericium alpestre]|uniref:Uncharacterized protein n=1 Tax=Hericium alpestre TaxID=135208 RepID=A0A4Z0A5Z1_9AGAM|nr:hypothetical protein EWM64_g2129 [Hericium alpestre]